MPAESLSQSERQDAHPSRGTTSYLSRFRMSCPLTSRSGRTSPSQKHQGPSPGARRATSTLRTLPIPTDIPCPSRDGWPRPGGDSLELAHDLWAGLLVGLELPSEDGRRYLELHD